jgi:Citrate lyase beta subunit
MSDLGGKHNENNQSIFTARSIVAMTAKAYDIAPLDIVHMQVHDLDDLEREIMVSRSLGYVGKMIVHPKEIPLCHKYFSPTEEDVAWAEEILELSAVAISEGRGVAVKNNKFIGPPMVKMAKEILKKNQLGRENLHE